MFVAPEHLSPRRSIVPGSRDEGKHDTPHVRLTLGGLSFPPRSLVFSSINTYLGSPRHRLPFVLDETSCG